MKLDLFNFDLPKNRIALRPFSPRDHAKLLHVTPDRMVDKFVYDLPSLLQSGDLLIFNDTKVIPARLRGKCGIASVEIMLHFEENAGLWRAFAKPAKKILKGDKIIFTNNFYAEVLEKEGGELLLSFPFSENEFSSNLSRFGEIPLPPYIKRSAGADEQDKKDYQTLFAKNEGAVAAPTAGLHFTPRLIETLKHHHIDIQTLTLHVGAGTFLPVRVEDIHDHPMHSERGILSEEVAHKIRDAKKNGRRIIAVGTTSLRLLETAASEDNIINNFSGKTNIFITPGYHFKVVDALITNFHLPCSTLFMLVAAFLGLDRMQEAYRYAIENNYRFYSYGDATLLERS